MQLSVVILNYNVRFFLEQCLISVQRALSGIEGEIIVVDNKSEDGSCEMVAANFPEVKLIILKENLGFPKGNNIGVQQAAGKYLCILNPDTVVPEDAFIKLMKFAGEKENSGITGVKMIDGKGNFLPESKRGVPTPWVAVTKVTGLYKVFPKWKAFNRYYAQHLHQAQEGAVDILTGAFMFIERDVYVAAGGFDESYFMYSEDMDLSYTVLQQGRQNYYYPGVQIIHYKGESTVRDRVYMQRFNDATNAFYRKHFGRTFFFDLFMKTGTFFFVASKGRSVSKPVRPQEYWLFSKNETLREVLESTLGKKVVRAGEYKESMLFAAKNVHNKTIEVIFDNELLGFSDIIAIMQRHHNDCYTFKIRPSGCKFIVGSQDSNGRGEVTEWQ